MSNQLLGPLLAAAASRLPRPPLAQVDRLRGRGGGGRGCFGPLLCPRDAINELVKIR